MRGRGEGDESDSFGDSPQSGSENHEWSERLNARVAEDRAGEPPLHSLSIGREGLRRERNSTLCAPGRSCRCTKTCSAYTGRTRRSDREPQPANKTTDAIQRNAGAAERRPRQAVVRCPRVGLRCCRVLAETRQESRCFARQRFNVSGRQAREREVVACLARTTFQHFASMLCEARLSFDVSRRLAPRSVRTGHPPRCAEVLGRGPEARGEWFPAAS
jgi:hypothetical protein